MFTKVLEYAGEYRKTTYAAIVSMLAGMVMNVLPFLFIYQIIRPILLREAFTTGYVLVRIAAIAVCVLLYAVLYIRGLGLSHESAYHTLKNLRISLQGKLEKQPLGVIQEKGVGAVKKMFIDDIESIELLLAHTLPEGIANLTIPALVFAGMFFVDWKLALGYVLERDSGVIKKTMENDVEELERFLAHNIPETVSSAVVPIAVLIYLTFVDVRLTLAMLVFVPFAVLFYLLMIPLRS